MKDKKELWLNIANYHFDHLAPSNVWDVIANMFDGKNPLTMAFADKLVRKLGWKKKFALRAIWEYKKFVYLGVISDFSVTPSKVIDKVWHEHLLFTSAYRKFCDEIIHYNFTHNPELVPIESQIDHFQSQYYQTIELYKKEFGTKPPADIWDNTKFNPRNAKKKNVNDDSYVNTSGDYSDGPLVSSFGTTDGGMFDFGGGESGGGGAGAGWDDGSNEASSNSSDSGSDSGSDSSDGGSSCSSGCGGGD